jgi:hypothetical protein
LGDDVPLFVEEIFVMLAFVEEASNQAGEIAGIGIVVVVFCSVGGGFQGVKILDESLAIETEVTYSKCSVRPMVLSNEYASCSWKKRLYALNTAGTDVKTPN